MEAKAQVQNLQARLIELQEKPEGVIPQIKQLMAEDEMKQKRLQEEARERNMGDSQMPRRALTPTQNGRRSLRGKKPNSTR